jgi:hypothetical protein
MVLRRLIALEHSRYPPLWLAEPDGRTRSHLPTHLHPILHWLYLLLAHRETIRSISVPISHFRIRLAPLLGATLRSCNNLAQCLYLWPKDGILQQHCDENTRIWNRNSRQLLYGFSSLPILII